MFISLQRILDPFCVMLHVHFGLAESCMFGQAADWHHIRLLV